MPTEPLIVTVKPLPDIVPGPEFALFVLAFVPEASHMCTWDGVVALAEERQYVADQALLHSLVEIM